MLAVVRLAFGEYAVLFLIVPAVLTAIVTIGYSYYLYGQIKESDKEDIAEP